MPIKNRSAFSLAEILITVLIISILVVATLVLLNPLTIVGKGVDAQRKSDLNFFKKKMEEFYNDKGCYPKVSEICFSGGINGDITNKTSCAICGTESTSPLALAPSYIDRLPCDPQHTKSIYLYSITEKVCPQSYAVYAQLSAPQDADSAKLGCNEGGCGPTNTFGYDYLISSPNSQPYIAGSWFCNIRGSCENCTFVPGYPVAYETCFHNPNCTGGVYPTWATCVAANPGAK